MSTTCKTITNWAEFSEAILGATAGRLRSDPIGTFEETQDGAITHIKIYFDLVIPDYQAEDADIPF